MSDPFQVGITRDFIAESGQLTYKDIGLGLLDAETRCRYQFLAENHNPVRPEQIASLDAVLSLTPAWKAETFAGGAERLLIVARFGVGYDMCDVAALTANDVLLTTTPGATDLPVAGGVLAMMLALSRRLFTKDRLVREGRWQRARLLSGDRDRRQGTGHCGLWRRRPRTPPPDRALWHGDAGLRSLRLRRAPRGARGKRAISLADLFSRSDYVSLHCLLNDETRGLVNKKLLDLMKPTAYLFNAARGPIVNEADLIDALQSGRIAGAGLDVFEQEPPALDNPLLQMENVVLAPHAVCWTDECFQAIGESAVRSILSVLHGERPFGVLNPEVLERKGFQAKSAAMRRPDSVGQRLCPLPTKLALRQILRSI